MKRLLQTLAGGMSAAAMLAPAAAIAQDAVHQFNIPAQDLGAALRAYGQQSGQQLGFDAAITHGRQSSALIGGYSADEGLRRLLGGTGLAFERSPAGVLVVQDPNSPTQLGDASGAAPSDDGATAEILVVGRRTLNADIRRTEDDSQPYVVFDRSAIERSGAQNAEDFLLQNLTAAASPIANSVSSGDGTNTSRINLRGLGADETLILIDGRRVGGYGSFGEAQQADINAIPLSAIERIEVLPTTASGIYGGGATGGVINIVLRRDYSGAELAATYGNTFDTDVASRRFDLSAGFNAAGGRTNILFAGSYSESSALLVGDRDFEIERRRRALAFDPNGFIAAFIPPIGGTTNIISATGADLTLVGSNTPLNAQTTFVPIGYGGPSTDGGLAFLDNAGSFNLDLADTAQPLGGARGTLLSIPTLWSLNLTIRHEFLPWLDGFIELGASENEGSARTNQGSGIFFVPAGAPSNPFNEDIFVTTPSFGADGRSQTSLQSNRIVGGVVADLPLQWRLAADLSWSENELSSSVSGFVDEIAAAAAVESGVIDVFRDTNISGAGFSPYLLAASTRGPADNRFTSGALRLSGPIALQLPGGRPTMTILAEHRTETLGDLVIVTESPGLTTRTLFPERSQDVTSVYAEARLPLFGAPEATVFSQTLELQLAARYDAYETSSALATPLDASNQPLVPIERDSAEMDSLNPTIGLRYQPVRALTLRASYGTGFLPPAVSQLVPELPLLLPLGLFGLTDPLRGDEPLGDVNYVFGGNTDLDPEETESWSAGLIFTPGFLPGLRASIDWTRIEKENAIEQLGISQEDLDTMLQFLPDRVERGPVAPGDPFGVGPIVSLDQTLVNLSTAEIEAIDYNVDYAVETNGHGIWRFGFNATQLLRQSRQITPAAAPIDNAGRLDFEWRANALVSWDYDDWTLTWNARYLDDICVDAGCSPASGFAPSIVLHDIAASYRFGGEDDPYEIRLGINNVFNEGPPHSREGSYSLAQDPRLANYYVTLRRSF